MEAEQKCLGRDTDELKSKEPKSALVKVLVPAREMIYN